MNHILIIPLQAQPQTVPASDAPDSEEHSSYHIISQTQNGIDTLDPAPDAPDSEEHSSHHIISQSLNDIDILDDDHDNDADTVHLAPSSEEHQHLISDLNNMPDDTDNYLCAELTAIENHRICQVFLNSRSNILPENNLGIPSTLSSMKTLNVQQNIF